MSGRLCRVRGAARVGRFGAHLAATLIHVGGAAGFVASPARHGWVAQVPISPPRMAMSDIERNGAAPGVDESSPMYTFAGQTFKPCARRGQQQAREQVDTTSSMYLSLIHI